LTEDELAKWIALGTIDDWSGEWHTATICKTIHNALLDLQRRGGMVFSQPEDTHYKSEADFFMSFKGERRRKQILKKPLTTQQQDQLFKRMAGL